jgi:hypothetical protein
MSSPAAGTYQDPNTGVWLAWDDNSQSWVPAYSTPDQSKPQMTADQIAAIEKIAPGLTTMIRQAQNPNENWTDTFTKIATNIGLGVQQMQLMNLNVQRARQGLPPIDVASYAGAGVNVGLSAGTQQLVTYAGLALVGLVLLNMATKK